MKGYTFGGLWLLFVMIIYNTILLVITAVRAFANDGWWLIGWALMVCMTIFMYIIAGYAICFNLYIGRKKEDLSLYQG